MDWPNEPATEQQLNLLRKLGFVPARPLSVTEAANLIRQYKKHPPSPVASHAPEPQTRPSESSPPPIAAPEPPDSRLVASHRFFPLRQTGESGQGVLGGIPGRSAVFPATGAPETNRVEFWLDTCREVKEMKVASARVYELRQRYGRQFRTPTPTQAQEILEALDAAMPSWEKDNPELFYRTMELNFPELLRDGGERTFGSHLGI